MRPAGEVRLALLASAATLTTPEQAPTLRELAHHAQVGEAAARDTVRNMHRSGALRVARTRRVDYRNRPVAEYAPMDAAEPVNAGQGFVDLAAAWGGASSSSITKTIKD